MALQGIFTKKGIDYNDAYLRIEEIKIYKTRKDPAEEGDEVVNQPNMLVNFAIYPNKEYANDYNIKDSLHYESIPLIYEEGVDCYEQAYEFIRVNKTYLFNSEELAKV